MSMPSYPTVTDQFCGAGGSSWGAAEAGAEIKLALNHWKLAIETHNTNFPQVDHDCTDVSACDPRRYRPTTILITSPECTNHSLAKGKMRKWQQQLDMFGKLELDPAEERSRATMWDVCRFAEAHHYQVVIVENVVEARHWPPFEAWLQAMHLLGYKHEIVYLNSMFAHPTPQSRDRMYIVFWKKNLRAPDLRITPAAHCPICGTDVASVQSWKNPLKKWGKYQQQYVYRCPDCAGEVVPYYFCAANAIDWSLPAPRIGDRTRPLKEKTRKRIQVGLEKFGRQPVIVDYVHTARNGRHQDMVWTADRPHRTQLGIHTQALVTPPFTVETKWSHAENDRTDGIDAALPTQTAQQGRGLVVPPMLVPLEHGDNQARPVTDAHPTQTSAQGNGVLVPPFMVSLNHSSVDRVRGVDDPMPTTMPQGNPALVVPFLVSTNYFRDNFGVDRPYPTQTSGNQYGVVMPPFLTSFYGTIQQSGMDQAVPTQPGIDKHGLVVPPFLVSYYTRLSGQQAAVSGLDEAAPTVPGRAVHYLAQPTTADYRPPTVDDCGFRMLQPHEIQAAMAFAQSYRVLGNQRQQVKQLGNAVTPPVMKLLVSRVIAILA